MWVLHPSFKNVLDESLNNPVMGTREYSRCSKLKNMKTPLKNLNINEYSHISERVKRVEVAYAEAQDQLMNDPYSNLLKNRIKECKVAVNFFLETEKMFYHQKLKNKHMLFVDRGTQYFHAQKSDGSLTSLQPKVILEFTNYFEQLLGTDFLIVPISADIILQGPVLSEADKDFLVTPISDYEIKDALFHIGDDKSLGRNGYTATFFKNN